MLWDPAILLSAVLNGLTTGAVYALVALGLTLIYGSNAAASVTVSTTQGVASKIYNIGTAALTPNTGTLAIAMKSLQDNDTKLNNDITQLNTQVSQYRTMLLNQFAALEKAVSQVNSLLASMSANDQARIAASGN